MPKIQAISFWKDNFKIDANIEYTMNKSRHQSGGYFFIRIPTQYEALLTNKDFSESVIVVRIVGVTYNALHADKPETVEEL